MPEEEKSLREFIAGDLLVQLKNIWRIAKKTYHPFQEGDNIQGNLHCRAVERNLGKLIPDKKKENLKPINLFILSAASCLHDIGKMAKDDGEWKRDHGKRSAEIILRDYEKLGLDKGQSVPIAYVVSVHNDGRLDELPDSPISVCCDQINLIELAAIFRLADILDTDYQRAPEIASAIKFSNGKSPQKWRGRQSVIGWHLDGSNRIILTAAPKNTEDIEAIYSLHGFINEDIAKLSPYLAANGYPWELGKLDMKGIFLDLQLTKLATAQKPFPGMGFYTKTDAALFKGRDAEIEKLLSIISNSPISLLIGESGSGKTSLINAGIFPRLENMGWECIWVRPFDNPQKNIRKEIWQTFFQGDVDPKKTLLDILKNAARAVKPSKLFVALDQFEEVLECGDQHVLDDLCMDLRAIQARTIIPNLRVLIAFREDASVRLNTRLLKKVTGSAQQFPSLELERLEREGAKKALLAGLEIAGIGVDAKVEVGQKPLVEIILDDILNGNDRIYPPFLQIVAEAICKKVDPKNPIVTREIYFEELNGASSIIANYLVNQLEEFGDEKERAKKILIALTSSSAKKMKKSLSQIVLETELSSIEVRSILTKMVDFRMVLPLGNDEFEIIHDYLGKIVDEQLVKEEVRTIKFVQEQLYAAQQAYRMNKTIVNSPVFMANLYRNRRKIRISEDDFSLLLGFSLLREGGSCWFFLKDVETKRIVELLKELASHPLPEIRERSLRILDLLSEFNDVQFFTKMLEDEDGSVRIAAAKALTRIAQSQNSEFMVKLIDHTDPYITQVAIEALTNIAQPKDRPLIIKLLQNSDNLVRQAAVNAFEKIAQHEDIELIINLFQDSDNLVRRAAVNAFEKIAQHEDIELIINLFEHENYNVREAAAQLLPKIAQPQDRKRINEIYLKYQKDNRIAQFQDGKRANEEYYRYEKDDLIQSAAAEALTKISLFQKEKTIKLQGSGGNTVQASLARALANNEVEPIISLLQHENYGVREAAAEALTKIAQPQNMGLIIELLRHENYHVCKAAAQVLPKIAQPQDRKRIIDLLQHENYHVREAAAEALTKIAQPQDREPIVKLLQHEDYGVRHAAAKVLPKIAQPQDKELLGKLMNYYGVREAAAEALTKIAQPQDTELLIELMLQYKEVQITAAKVLANADKVEEREAILDSLSERAQGWSKNHLKCLSLLSVLDQVFYSVVKQYYIAGVEV